MRKVYFVCSTVNHLRFVRSLLPQYAKRGIPSEILHMDFANLPEGGGVAQAVGEGGAFADLSNIPHRAYDVALQKIALPAAGFRSLRLASRIGLLRRLTVPELDFTDATVIVFNDAGAFERRLLREAHRQGAFTVFIQDGLTNLRPKNPASLAYFNLVKNSPAYPFLPLPQSAGPWDLGFFIGDFWAEDSRRWHLPAFGRRPVVKTAGPLHFWEATPSSSSPPVSRLRVGILCASYENARDWTPTTEALFLKSFAQTLHSIDAEYFLRLHPRQNGEATILAHLARAGVKAQVMPASQSLREFSESADLFFALGSYSGFEVMQMGRPCYIVMRPFSRMIRTIADAWGEPSEYVTLNRFTLAASEIRRDPSKSAKIRSELLDEFERFVAKKGMTPEHLVQAIESESAGRFQKK